VKTLIIAYSLCVIYSSNQNCVYLLSIDNFPVLNLSKHDDDVKLATEQRIAQILSEAQRAMQQQQQLLPQTETSLKVFLAVICHVK
jgi:hypothetical protein